MSATPIIGDKTAEVNAPKIAERIRRGIDLYSSRHADIRHHGDRVEVPSCTGRGRYVVRLDPEHCSCPDFRRNGDELGCCKHTVAAMIADAKRVEFRVERRHDSRFGLDLFYLVEVRRGSSRDVARRCALGDIYRDKWEHEGGRAVA